MTTTETLLDEALDPKKLNVLEYLDNQPVLKKEVKIFVDIVKTDELVTLLDERQKELAKRKDAERRGSAEAISLADANDDTQFDDRINELTAELDKTALIFELQTVAPKVTQAITKKYLVGTKGMSQEELDQREEDRLAEIYAKAIASVRVGEDGEKNTDPWTKEQLQGLNERLYHQQSVRLVNHLSEMVFVGHKFEEALTADFS